MRRYVLKFCHVDKISIRICVFEFKQLHPCTWQCDKLQTGLYRRLLSDCVAVRLLLPVAAVCACRVEDFQSCSSISIIWSQCHETLFRVGENVALADSIQSRWLSGSALMSADMSYMSVHVIDNPFPGNNYRTSNLNLKRDSPL